MIVKVGKDGGDIAAATWNQRASRATPSIGIDEAVAKVCQLFNLQCWCDPYSEGPTCEACIASENLKAILTNLDTRQTSDKTSDTKAVLEKLGRQAEAVREAIADTQMPNITRAALACEVLVKDIDKAIKEGE